MGNRILTTAPGKALLFSTPSGENWNSVYVAHDPLLDLTTDWTLALWARQDDNSGEWTGVWGRYVSCPNYEFESGGAGDENNYFWPWDAPDWQFACGASPPLGEWHHLAVTYDGVTFRKYVDGVETFTRGDLPASLPAATWDYLYIGQEQTNDRFFVGAMDDVVIFNETLNKTQIDAIRAGDFSAWLAAVPEASKPRPRDGSTDVSIFAILTWTAGIGATEHTVYGPSTDEAAVTNGTAASTTVTEASYDPPGNLALNTKYFWRVDENNGSGEGTVWSFTTSPFDVLEPFDYASDTSLQSAWQGSPSGTLHSLDEGWMAMPYAATAQTYERTFAEPPDLSSAAYLYLDRRQNEANAVLVPDVTISLLDGSDTVLVSDTLTEPEVEEVATWRISLLNIGQDLSTVKKIRVEVPGSNATGQFDIDAIGISTPWCVEPPQGDIDGDCDVDFSDFALMIEAMFECGVFPADFGCPDVFGGP